MFYDCGKTSFLYKALFYAIVETKQQDMWKNVRKIATTLHFLGVTALMPLKGFGEHNMYNWITHVPY